MDLASDTPRAQTVRRACLSTPEKFKWAKEGDGGPIVSKPPRKLIALPPTFRRTLSAAIAAFFFSIRGNFVKKPPKKLKRENKRIRSAKTKRRERTNTLAGRRTGGEIKRSSTEKKERRWSSWGGAINAVRILDCASQHAPNVLLAMLPRQQRNAPIA